jgi:hypothetical protein
MRTWILVASVVCLVLSVVWLSIFHVAGLRTWKAALGGMCVACFIGSAVGSATVYIAMDHNPQEEFISHATGAINYAGLAEIFVSWFTVVSLATGFILALVVWLWADGGCRLRFAGSRARRSSP